MTSLSAIFLPAQSQSLSTSEKLRHGHTSTIFVWEHSGTTGNMREQTRRRRRRRIKNLFGKAVLPENESVCDERAGILNVMFPVPYPPETARQSPRFSMLYKPKAFPCAFSLTNCHFPLAYSKTSPQAKKSSHETAAGIFHTKAPRPHNVRLETGQGLKTLAGCGAEPHVPSVFLFLHSFHTQRNLLAVDVPFLR